MSDIRKSDDWFAHILEETPESTTLTVQNYGALVILDCAADEPFITHVSENVHEVCGVTIEQALHHRLADICEPSQWVGLIAQAREKQRGGGHDNSDGDVYSSARVTLVSGKLMWMVLHAQQSAVVCELIPVVQDALNDDAFVESALQRLCQLLTPQMDSIFRVAQVATAFINETLGFDRCVLYRFEPSPGFGEIIAEHISSDNQRDLVPFLGLRFPPQQFTRPMIDLYWHVKVRMLAEVFDSTSLIVSKKSVRARRSSVLPLELPIAGDVEQVQDLLIHSVLRGATSQDKDQLIAMNVRNCMTAVLFTRERSLWGAVQCINVKVKAYSWSHRLFLARAVELLSKFISDTLINIDEQELALLRHNCRQVALVDAQVHDECFLVQPLLQATSDLFEILQGELGVVCLSGDSVFRVGQVPSADVIHQLSRSMLAAPPSPVQRLTDVLPFLESVNWPNPSHLLAALRRHETTSHYLCWEASSGKPAPLQSIDASSWDCALGVVFTATAAPVGLFFFREKRDDFDRISHTLSSSILNNTLVADTMERYSARWSRSDIFIPGTWGFRQRVIFQLLASLLQEKVNVDHTAHRRLDGLWGVTSDTLHMRSRLVHNDDTAQVLFRKCVRSDGTRYYCLNANTQFTLVFGSYTALKLHHHVVPSDNRAELEQRPVDLQLWLAGVGLELDVVCVSGQRVVRQQSLWSKTKGHIRATLTCRFIYGTHDQAQDTDELYTLDVRDDTMSHRVESALIYAHQHLARAERLKQDLVGTVSHELRTPLMTAILGFHEVLYQDLKQRNCITPDAQQSLDYISSAAVHLRDTVTNLLDLSRTELTSKKRSRVDLITVLQEACRWVEMTAKKQGIKVRMAVLTSSPTSSLPPPAAEHSKPKRRHSTLGSPGSHTAHHDDDDRDGNTEKAGHNQSPEPSPRMSHVPSEFDDEFLHEPSMSVFGDIVALKRVFVNLLDNAIKFSPSSTTVSVSIRWIRAISLLDESGYVNVVVEDQGIGIAAENLANIFRPFFQVDLSDIREQKGVGLGLSLVRQLIDLHKGRISVRSKLGQGTRFDVTLPAYTSDSPEQLRRTLNSTVASPLETEQHPLLGPAKAEPTFAVRQQASEVQPYILPPTRTSMSSLHAAATPVLLSRHVRRVQSAAPAAFDSTTCIMVVDDNSVNRRLLHRMLSTLGFSNVVECENGQDALDTVALLVAAPAAGSSESAVSLMFLDIQMPVRDGPSTACELRKQRHNFPIVAFSASNWKDDSDRTVPLFDAFLPKPINTPVLTEILDRFLRH